MVWTAGLFVSSGIGGDASGSIFWMEKEVLMTDFELLSLVISIIGLTIIVLKK